MTDREKQLEAALRNLVNRLDAVHADKHYQSVWTMYMIHGGDYRNGPKYDKELEAAHAALAGQPARCDFGGNHGAAACDCDPTDLGPPAPPAPELGKVPEGIGVELISRERARQISSEGWTPEHDDYHTFFELSRAAICYLLAAVDAGRYGAKPGPLAWWPWEPVWWKPSEDTTSNLVKSAALIAAEIDRIQRKRAALNAAGGGK